MPEITQAAISEILSHTHIIDCISSSISEDGALALLVFLVKDSPEAEPRKFAMTLNVEFLPWLRGVIQDTLSKVKVGFAMPPNAVVFKSMNEKGIEDIQVALSPDMPDLALLRTNPNRPEELGIVITMNTCAALGKLCADAPEIMKAELAKSKTVLHK